MSEVAIVENSQIISVAERFSAGSVTEKIYTSYDRDSKQGKLQLLAALSDCESVSDYVGEEVQISGFTVHEVEFVDEDGVVNTGRRTILDTDKGLLSAMSGGIEKALMNAIAVFGPAEHWTEPIRAKVVELKSRRGFRFLSLKPIVAD